MNNQKIPLRKQHEKGEIGQCIWEVQNVKAGLSVLVLL